MSRAGRRCPARATDKAATESPVRWRGYSDASQSGFPVGSKRRLLMILNASRRTSGGAVSPTPTKTWKAPGVAEPEPVVEHLDRWLVTPRTVRLGGGAVGPRGRAGEFGVGLEAGGPGRKVLLAVGARPRSWTVTNPSPGGTRSSASQIPSPRPSRKVATARISRGSEMLAVRLAVARCHPPGTATV